MKNYNVISMVIAIAACIPFFISYEKKKTSARKIVILAVMTAFAVAGRIVFSPIPGFKPVAAFVILTGIYLGPEAGFLTGAFDAILSNLFFGQGPWTPYQMAGWGVIGLIAGLPVICKILKKRIPLALYGALAGFLYSAILDIWTVLSMDGFWSFKRFFAVQITALPFTLEYVVSNVIFLMLLIYPVGRKMDRLEKKYGIR